MSLHPAPAAPDVATAFFAAKLACETDASDVAAALASGDPGFVLLDTRGDAAWEQGRIPGARHVPTAAIPDADLDPDVVVVTYCWGPGCNGATRGALAAARRGLRVKEMVGGVEYWVREGMPLETDDGLTTAPVDPLTASCECSAAGRRSPRA